VNVVTMSYFIGGIIPYSQRIILGDGRYIVGASRPARNENVLTLFEFVRNPVAYADTIAIRFTRLDLHVLHGRCVLFVKSPDVGSVEAALALPVR